MVIDIEAKQFAPNVPREEGTGWLLFPRDVEYRKSQFPQEVFNHPAKANCFLIEALVEYLTIPGQSIIDPFGGTGTLLLAAQRGRKVVLIDVEPQFVEVQSETVKKWRDDTPDLISDVFIYHGDNKRVLKDLPYLCDASIFSPPYSQAAMGSKVGFKDWRESGDLPSQVAKIDEYGGAASNPQNLGRLNPFQYAQALDLIYERLSGRLVPGAPVAIITKDIMKGPERTFISTANIQRCQRHGLEYRKWFKWKPPGSMMKKVLKSQGASVVEEEDILIFQKKV